MKKIETRQELKQKITELEFESQIQKIEITLLVRSLPYRLLNDYTSRLSGSLKTIFNVGNFIQGFFKRK